MNIIAKVHEYKFSREKLLADYPELADDAETLLDTLEGITDLHGVIEALIKSAEEDKAFAGAIGDLISDYSARKSRLMNRYEAKRTAVLNAMQESGLSKVECPFATISVSKGRPKVIITEEVLIPDDYLVAQPSTVDKKLLAQALNDGFKVPGATLSNAMPTLTVRKS